MAFILLFIALDRDFNNKQSFLLDNKTKPLKGNLLTGGNQIGIIFVLLSLFPSVIEVYLNKKKREK